MLGTNPVKYVETAIDLMKMAVHLRIVVPASVAYMTKTNLLQVAKKTVKA